MPVGSEWCIYGSHSKTLTGTQAPCTPQRTEDDLVRRGAVRKSSQGEGTRNCVFVAPCSRSLLLFPSATSPVLSAASRTLRLSASVHMAGSVTHHRTASGRTDTPWRRRSRRAYLGNDAGSDGQEAVAVSAKISCMVAALGSDMHGEAVRTAKELLQRQCSSIRICHAVSAATTHKLQLPQDIPTWYQQTSVVVAAGQRWAPPLLVPCDPPSQAPTS